MEASLPASASPADATHTPDLLAQAITNTQAETSVVTEGREAWTRIKAASKMLREDWRKVGAALNVGKALFTATSGGLNKKGFGQWVRENGFDDVDRNVRGDAMWLADRWEEVNAQSLCISPDLCHPTAIRAAYNEAQQPTAAPEPAPHPFDRYTDATSLLEAWGQYQKEQMVSAYYEREEADKGEDDPDDAPADEDGDEDEEPPIHVNDPNIIDVIGPDDPDDDSTPFDTDDSDPTPTAPPAPQAQAPTPPAITEPFVSAAASTGVKPREEVTSKDVCNVLWTALSWICGVPSLDTSSIEQQIHLLPPEAFDRLEAAVQKLKQARAKS